MSAYAELFALSSFSFLRAASQPAELVSRAAELGYEALALTDECSLAGIVRAHQAAKSHGLRLLVGTSLRLEEGPELVLLAPDRRAYSQLCGLITRGRRRAEKGRYRLERADMQSGLDACLGLFIVEAVTPLVRVPDHHGHDSAAMADTVLAAWRTAFRWEGGHLRFSSGMLSAMRS